MKVHTWQIFQFICVVIGALCYASVDQEESAFQTFRIEGKVSVVGDKHKAAGIIQFTFICSNNQIKIYICNK